MKSKTERACEICGKMFAAFSDRHKFCSKKCEREAFYSEHRKLAKEVAADLAARDKERLKMQARLAERDRAYEADHGKQDGEVRGRVPGGCAGVKHVWTSQWQ